MIDLDAFDARLTTAREHIAISALGHSEFGECSLTCCHNSTYVLAAAAAAPEMSVELRDARERLRLIVAALEENAADLAADRYGALVARIEALADLTKPRVA